MSTILLLSVPQPSAHRDWALPYAGELSVISQDDGGISISGVRDFHWLSADDADAQWVTKRLAPDGITEAWLAVIPFSADSSLAHIMVSFGYRDQRGGTQYLTISIEARQEMAEIYHPIAGAYGRYEITYIVGTEQDLFGLRALFRGDQIALYPSSATPAQAQALFVAMMTRALALQDEPELYHSLYNNCTGNVVDHIHALWPAGLPWWDWRSIATAHAGELAAEGGLLRADCQVADPRWQVSDRIREIGVDRIDFGAAMRQGLLPMNHRNLEALGR